METLHIWKSLWQQFLVIQAFSQSLLRKYAILFFYILCYIVANSLYQFKADSHSVKNSHKIAACKQMLNLIEDRVMRYDLAKELLYEDVANNVAANTPGFEYFREVKVPTKK